MDSAHTSPWEISEVVFGIPLMISLAIQWLVPLSLPDGTVRQILIPVGVVLLLVGLAFIVLARREFARHGQSMEPGRPIGEIIHTGVFAISRNPLYLGIAIALFGIGLIFNILWISIFLIPAILLCHYVLIAPEERYLEAKFGKEYIDYARSVRRWVGRR